MTTKAIKDMTKGEIKGELLQHNRADLCDIITMLMDEDAISITDINASYVQHLNNIIRKKDTTIEEADECIFESLFTDSMGKPADNAGILKKLKWMEKVGAHNTAGLMKYFRENSKTKLKGIENEQQGQG